MTRPTLTNYLRGACLAAFIGCGAWYSWRDISHAPVEWDNPAVATDSAAEVLLGIPDFSARLPVLLKGASDQPLLIVAPEDPWMSGDLVRLASILLRPRPVIRWQPGTVPKVSAILFYKTNLPPALASQAQPLGPNASIVMSNGNF